MPSHGNVNVLSRPSSLELYRSGLPGSAWLLSLGVILVVGSITYYSIALRDNPWDGSLLLLGAWVIGGILGFIGFYAITNALKVERLRLAAHMLRSISLHAVLARSKGSDVALRLVGEMERRERGFIARAFAAAGVDAAGAFAASAVEAVRRGSEPPYILVYRDGVLDAPSTLVANLTARTVGAVVGLLAFTLLGLIMLTVGVIVGSVIVYTTARALRNHARLENEVRRILGLDPVPEEAPGIGGLLASILTGGIYLPLYAGKLVEGIDAHISTH